MKIKKRIQQWFTRTAPKKLDVRFVGNTTTIEDVNTLLKVANNVQTVKFDLEKMDKFGFIKTPKKNSVTGKIWINYELKIVVKQPYLITKEKTPENSILTCLLKNAIGDIIFIQPLAEIVYDENNTEASNKLYSELCAKEKGGFDLHFGNIGIYQGRPVMFDW